MSYVATGAFPLASMKATIAKVQAGVAAAKLGKTTGAVTVSAVAPAGAGMSSDRKKMLIIGGALLLAGVGVVVYKKRSRRGMTSNPPPIHLMGPKGWAVPSKAARRRAKTVRSAARASVRRRRRGYRSFSPRRYAREYKIK